MLTTWCAKLGIQEPKGLEIPEGFLGRLEQLVSGGRKGDYEGGDAADGTLMMMAPMSINFNNLSRV
jgi:hypothetical protein